MSGPAPRVFLPTDCKRSGSAPTLSLWLRSALVAVALVVVSMVTVATPSSASVRPDCSEELTTTTTTEACVQVVRVDGVDSDAMAFLMVAGALVLGLTFGTLLTRRN